MDSKFHPRNGLLKTFKDLAGSAFQGHPIDFSRERGYYQGNFLPEERQDMFRKDPLRGYPEEVMFQNDNVRIATTVIECADCVGGAGCSIYAYLKGLKQAIILAQQSGEDTVKGLDELDKVNQLAVRSDSLHVFGGGGPVIVYQCSQGDGLLKLDVHYTGELA